MRIFGLVKWFRNLFLTWNILIALFYRLNIVTAVVDYIPRKGKAWDGTSFQRYSRSACSAVMIGICSALAELVIFLLPFPVLLHLQIQRSRKISLIIGFLTDAL
jgi:hypothetical protein